MMTTPPMMMPAIQSVEILAREKRESGEGSASD